MRPLLCLLAGLLLSTSHSAWSSDTPPSLEELSSQPAWLKLLHYEKNSPLHSRMQSAISSPEFFLAANGHVDPLAELEATLGALQDTTEKSPGTHAACRFPARALWLKSQLGHDLVLADAQCPELDQWTRHNSVSSISVIFATGYLGNPASYYGHTLLKFNFRDDNAQGSLMDLSLNYGAIVENDDDPVTYIVKGIFGGYDGGFSHINFYFHNHNYGENELRDMWEYQLELPQQAVDMIAAHAWEVLGKRYTYYFFRRNCAYRMAEILEVVDGLSIAADWRPWTIPQSLTQSLGEANYKGASLLSEVSYHPSRQARLYGKYSDLTPDEKRLFRQLALDEARFTDTAFTQTTLTSQHRVLDTLLDYYQLVRDRGAGDQDPANLAHRKTLSMRYQLPPGVPFTKALEPESPHTGRAPGWLQLGVTHNPDLPDSLAIRIRPAYYDALDADQGHIRQAGLSMGDLRLQVSGGNVRLRQLDILSIASMNPGHTDLPGDKSTAWNLKVGVEPLRLDCKHCLVPRIQADRGVGAQLNNNLFGAAYIGAAVQENRLDEGYGFARVTGSMHLVSGPKWNTRLQVEYRQPVASSLSAYGTLQLETRRRIGSRNDLRLLYEHNRGEELTIALGHHW